MSDPPEGPDGALLIAYLCDELSEAERVRAEIRLANEPALAARLEDLLELELVGEARRRQGKTAPRAPAARGRLLGWTLGLAGAAAAAGLAWWLGVGAADGGDAPTRAFSARAVAVASVEDPAGYAAALGLPDDVVPADRLRSGEPQATGATVETFLDAVRAAEQARDRDAFAAAARPAQGHFVTVRFTCEVTSSAVVVALDNGGALRRRYPSPPSTFVFGEVENRFEPGAVHVLPRPVAVPTATGDQVSVFPGFDVTGDPERPRMWLTLAIRDRAVDEGLLQALDAFLDTLPRATDAWDAAPSMTPTGQEALADTVLAPVESWLADRGFATERIEAVTPR